MQLSDSLIKEMKEKIYNHTYHSYLTKQIVLPEIDDNKLILLLTILLQSNKLSQKELETIALTVMLIQIALDTHDFVKNDDEEIESMEVQQLTVLAGDFYSGLYYKELSYLPNIHLIRCLAEAIKIINENKIRVYQREITTFEDFMHSMKIIETSLYKKIATYLGVTDYERFSADWLHINHIIKNQRKYKHYILINNLEFKENPNKSPIVADEIDNILNSYVEDLNRRLQNHVKDWEYKEKFLDYKLLCDTRIVQ